MSSQKGHYSDYHFYSTKDGFYFSLRMKVSSCVSVNLNWNRQSFLVQSGAHYMSMRVVTLMQL